MSLTTPVRILPVAHLRLAVHDMDPRVRHAAVNSLGEFNEQEALDSVISALEHDNDRVVREVVAAAVGRTENAVPVLIGAPKDEYANVQINAATAFGYAGRLKTASQTPSGSRHLVAQENWVVILSRFSV